MDPVCPHCGFVSRDEAPRFCSACGARMDGYPLPAAAPPGATDQQKSTATAGLCSSLLPGLGQVYNGETGKGFILFVLTLGGLVLFIVPGLIVWLYAMYDAYAVAGKMNNGTLEYRPTNMLHMLGFILFAVVIIVIALLIIVAMVIASLATSMGPLGLGTSDISAKDLYGMM
jgi:TM2 domain-containing membrane protein YozV